MSAGWGLAARWGRVGSWGLRRIAKRVAAAVIIATAVVTFGLSTNHEVRTTASLLSSSSLKLAAATDSQLECIYQAIRSEVPRGAVIYAPEDHNPFTYQRLEELVTLWAIPAATRARANYDLFLYKTPGRCGGRALAVRRIAVRRL